MIVAVVTGSRRALLKLELSALGVDTRRLGFYEWLVEHGRDPEWAVASPSEADNGMSATEGNDARVQGA